MDIRTLTLVDIESYQSLLHRAYQPILALGIHFSASTVSKSEIEQHLLANLVFGGFIDGNLVCSISLRLPWGNNPGPYGVPHIGWLATHPDYKKQGLAVELIKWTEENILLKQLKVPFVTLGTAENHPWLNSFYIKQGFEEIGKANLTDDHTTIYYRKILNTTLFQEYQKHHH